MWNSKFYSPPHPTPEPGQQLTGTVFHTNGVCVPLDIAYSQSCYEIELAAVAAMHLPHGTLVTVLKNPANTIHGFCMRVFDDSQPALNARAALVFGDAINCQGPVFLLQYDPAHHRYTSVTDAVFTEFWSASLPPAAATPAAGTEVSVSDADGCVSLPTPPPPQGGGGDTGADTRDAMLPAVLQGLPSLPSAPPQSPLPPAASNQSMDNMGNSDGNPRPSKRRASTRKTDKLDSNSSTLPMGARTRKPPTRFTY
jgi:hypothetical protein